MADLFFLIVKDIDFAGYADDGMSFIVEDNIENFIASLEEASKALFDWFKNNRLKSNPDKFYALVSTKKHSSFKIGDYKIQKQSPGSVRRCFDKKKLLTNAFFTSHFSFCPLIWMCHTCTYIRTFIFIFYIILLIFTKGEEPVMKTSHLKKFLIQDVEAYL